MEKKIVDSLVAIHKGSEETLNLGNLDAKRDIGHAKEYVEGMWRMLQQETPEDFVLSTGICFSVREIVETVYQILGNKIRWEGEGLEEKGLDVETGKIVVSIDPKYFRPSEVDLLIGNPKKAKDILGWESNSTIRGILEEMVNEQIKK
jgi:GDPmannose 4,6-dehydratase